MIKLYQLEGCWYCQMVREKLAELGIIYEKIEVPSEREKRKEVFKLSGQYLVPVLHDGDTILSDEDEIIEYLERVYGKRGQR